MSGSKPAIDLPESISSWVEERAGALVALATRHFAGASREAWNVDVESGSESRGLFLLRDKGRGGGSARDAAVLKVLSDTSVPVPRVVGLDADRGLILLERLPGRSDFPNVDQEAERESTARHLMQLTGELHSLDIADLEIVHLEKPESPEACAGTSLEQIRSAWARLGVAADPFFAFALDWLEAHVPREVSRYSLVHSDMGPGNFLYEGGRITGIVDWEVAHYGDPMEDLAAIAVRDMATPVGHLPSLFREYEKSCGTPVVIARVHYYRALVLVRNSLMIGLGLAHPVPGFDVVEMTMYQTLLMRAAALVLCDNLGVARPTVEDSLPSPMDDDGAGLSFAGALRREVEETIAPAIEDATARRSAARVARGLEMFEHEARIGARLDRRERREIEAFLATTADAALRTDGDMDRALRDSLTAMVGDEDARKRGAAYFARRFHRLAERRRPLMGELRGRFPQPLEDE